METKTTADLIEEARVTKDRSRRWTAEKAGMALSTFNRKLNGGPDFTISETRRVALALEVPPYTLLPSDFMPVTVEQQRSAA